MDIPHQEHDIATFASPVVAMGWAAPPERLGECSTLPGAAAPHPRCVLARHSRTVDHVRDPRCGVCALYLARLGAGPCASPMPRPTLCWSSWSGSRLEETAKPLEHLTINATVSRCRSTSQVRRTSKNSFVSVDSARPRPVDRSPHTSPST